MPCSSSYTSPSRLRASCGAPRVGVSPVVLARLRSGPSCPARELVTYRDVGTSVIARIQSSSQHDKLLRVDADASLVADSVQQRSQSMRGTRHEVSFSRMLLLA